MEIYHCAAFNQAITENFVKILQSFDENPHQINKKIVDELSKTTNSFEYFTYDWIRQEAWKVSAGGFEGKRCTR